MSSFINKRRGFTLVELIVVITVIGVLTGGVALSISKNAVQARNTRRKTDLQQIKSALEFYRSDNTLGFYPQKQGDGTNANTRYKRVSGGVTTYELVQEGYLDEVPVDPSTGTDYTYEPRTSSNTACTNDNPNYCVTYTLTATLESGGTYQVSPTSVD